MIVSRCGATLAVAVLVALLSSGTPALAQSPTRGALDGVVRGSTGEALGGTSVVLRELGGGASRSVATAGDGRFDFGLLLPGEYELFVERFGSRPQQVRGVRVQPGHRVTLPITLQSMAEVATRADTVLVAGGAGEEVAGGRQFSGRELEALPEEHRGLGTLTRFSSVSGPELEVEGLPAQLGTVLVDGLRVAIPRGPSGTAGRLGWAHLPLSGFEWAELLPSSLDVESSGGGGGVLAAYTRRGTPRVRGQAFGRLAGLVSSTTGDPFGATGGDRSAEAGVVVTGPLASDAASFALGLEAWRVESPLPAAGADSLGARVASIAAETFGAPLGGATRTTLPTDVLSGFSRLDWQVAAAHSLSVRSNFALVPRAREWAGAAADLQDGSLVKGGQLSAGADLVSRLGDRVSQALRFSTDISRRRYGSGAAAGTVDPLASGAGTRVLGSDATYGIDAGSRGRFDQAGLRASETLYVTSGPHRLKGGFEAGFTSYDFRYDESRSGQFLFASPDDFAQGRGLFVQTVGRASEAVFTVPELGVYAQDEWRAAPGLELTGGLRYDLEAMPKGKVTPNREWIVRTGLDPAGFRSVVSRIGPRLGFRWRPGEQAAWVAEGAAGIFAGSTDPYLLADFLAHDGSAEVRRGSGGLTRWPLLPDSSDAPIVGPRLTLLAPGFAAPRTMRTSLDVGRLLGAAGGIHLSFVYRKTDFLPRVHDVNLVPVSVGRDQYDRPIYGRLVRQGALLAADPGSNRRFTGFDQVLSMDVDGWSEYRGVTLSAEHRGAGGWELAASYTRSRTRDNRVLARGAGPDLSPFPEEGTLGWAVGTSDFDVPNRAVVTLTAPAPGLPRASLAAFYRFQSGYPFTPGFRPGVDANGDGSSGNDPAFVDASLPGMDALLARWPCLREQSGRISARNACRGPNVHTLDLRMSLALGRADRSVVALVVDGLNLLATRNAEPDRALYRIDEGGTFAGAPTGGSVLVPLRVDDHFGEPLPGLREGRILRLGLRVSY